jgi:hypothetical protein
LPEALRDLGKLPQRVTVMDCDVAQVRDYIVRHADDAQG